MVAVSHQLGDGVESALIGRLGKFRDDGAGLFGEHVGAGADALDPAVPSDDGAQLAEVAREDRGTRDLEVAGARTIVVRPVGHEGFAFEPGQFGWVQSFREERILRCFWNIRGDSSSTRMQTSDASAPLSVRCLTILRRVEPLFPSEAE